MSKWPVRIVWGAVAGVTLAELVVAGFVGVLLLFALNASAQTGLSAPVSDTLALWPPLATLTLPAGLLVGVVAGSVSRRRAVTLTAVASAAYVAVSVGAVVWMTGAAPAGQRASWVLLGIWAGVAYAIFAVPLWSIAVVVLERCTRPKRSASKT